MKNQLEVFVAAAWFIKNCKITLESNNGSDLYMKIVKYSSNDPEFCMKIDPFDGEKAPELEKAIGEYIRRD